MTLPRNSSGGVPPCKLRWIPGGLVEGLVVLSGEGGRGYDSNGGEDWAAASERDVA
jgi:hypothetical protein